MRITPINHYDHQILSEMNRSFRSYVLRRPRDVSRSETVRASALPFCVRSFLVNAASPTSELDAFGAFFTSVGTTVHTWVQDIGGRTNLVLGNWYNRKTQKWRKFSLHPDPDNPDWEYHELRAEALGAVGHCDGVFCLDRRLARKANKEKSKKKRLQAFIKLKVPLFVIDYKTCTAPSVSKKVQDSGNAYTLQLLFYCLHFHNLGLNVRGYGNFYIPRDNPAKWNMNARPWSAANRKYIKKKIKYWVDLHERACSIKTWKQFKKIYEEGGDCGGPYCEVCRQNNGFALFKDAYKRGSWPLFS